MSGMNDGSEGGLDEWDCWEIRSRVSIYRDV